jgi:ribonuclease J
MPVHGEYRHLVHYRDLALETGLPSDRIVLADVGDVVEVGPERVAIAGRVAAGSVLVDGLTVGGVDHAVLRDRRHLATEGVIVAAVTLDRETGDVIEGPELTARGFVTAAAQPYSRRRRPAHGAGSIATPAARSKLASSSASSRIS